MNVTLAEPQAVDLSASIENILSVARNGPGPCVVRDVLDRVGDKWWLLTVLNLGATESLRFNELRKQIAGISQRMLTVTLRSLEADGLVVRTAYAEVPPRVEYRLTALGRSLLVAVVQLGAWATAHTPAITRARRAFAG